MATATGKEGSYSCGAGAGDADGDRCRRDRRQQHENGRRELTRSTRPRIRHAVLDVTSHSRWPTRKGVLPSS